MKKMDNLYSEGNFEDLMEEYNIKSVEQLAKILSIIKSLGHVKFNIRLRLAKECDEWLKQNKLMYSSLNIITWLLCIRIKEVCWNDTFNRN